MTENPGADRIADLLETRMSGDARRTLSDLARNARRVPAQTHILDELDEAPEVVLLFDGWVSLYKTLGEGHNQIVDFAIPLEIVHPASADGHTATFSMQAVTESTVLTLKAARWDQLLAGDRGLARLDAVLSRAARSRVSERMLRLGQANAKTCVAYALVELCLRLGARGRTDECAYHLPITQQKLGEFVGLTSVHVCRILGQMSDAGIIESTDHIDIRVHDPDALLALAGVEFDALAGEILPPLG
ncbi:Crp/Fnr family transcriptional regulator [Roseovarius sp. SYSU LYC5161]|uniref:Crp/Fnr family transcriptional regulator n=1 Tax=Roseovarius halophilus (ex Wu et al. 2025) TaxID=3376060 RepID=UPI00399A3F0E